MTATRINPVDGDRLMDLVETFRHKADRALFEHQYPLAREYVDAASALLELMVARGELSGLERMLIVADKVAH
jgi:predicted Ser/Thr protein kinase